MPSEPRRYACERCGGTGHVIAGCWNPATEKYDSPAGVCSDCGGIGKLGVIKQSQPTLDLEALLAIVRRRTPGEWEAIDYQVFVRADCRIVAYVRGLNHTTRTQKDKDNTAAIVAAVNNIEAVVERCKRAEQFGCEVDRVSSELSKIEDKQQRELIIELTSQRDELLTACKLAQTDARVWKENAELAAKACVKAMEQRDELFKACKHAVEAMGAHGPCTRHSCSDCKATWKELNALVYGVKGGDDGQA